MRGSRHGLILAALIGGAVSAPAAAEPVRQLVKLEAGQSAQAYGAELTSSGGATALVSLSSEFVTVAVIEGALSERGTAAKAGEALIAPIDGGKIQRFGFDAQRLAATMAPEWLATTKPALDQIAVRQKRQRFWGVIERTNVNTSAPKSREMEAARSGYLGNATITALRQEAKGNPQMLAVVTAKRFAVALAAHDAATVADLIDPKSFTDTGADTGAWQAARGSFAAKLVADDALVAAMTSEPAAVASDQTAFDAGGYRIRLIPRDRAMFVMSVEAL